jgi:hypothetical protein
MSRVAPPVTAAWSFGMQLEAMSSHTLQAQGNTDPIGVLVRRISALAHYCAFLKREYSVTCALRTLP